MDWTSVARKIPGFGKEPAITLGIIGSLILTIQAELTDGDIFQWRDALPIIAGVVIRFFVFAPKNVPDKNVPVSDESE